MNICIRCMYKRKIYIVMQLFVESGKNYTFLLELIVDYLKLSERNFVKLVYLSPSAIKAISNGALKLSLPSLVTSQATVQTQIFQICRNLFEMMPQWRSFFLGQGEQAKQIAEIKTVLKQGKQLRKHINKHLQPRTFFVGNHISFADLYMFTQLYDNVVDMSDEQKLQYNNLFRWYKHIQNLPQVRQYLTEKNRFLVTDPVVKVPFLNEKKKAKKEKKPAQGKPEGQKQEVKKEEKPAEASMPKQEAKTES